MYLLSPQAVLAAGLALTDSLTSSWTTSKWLAKGKIMDYAVEKCLDKDGNQRCTEPFFVRRETCYKLEWSTEGKLTHTTAEIRDAGSHELVYYRDTNGEWEPEKAELVYMDFKPKIPKTGNDTVSYKVTPCK